jgi:hypothetical protein
MPPQGIFDEMRDKCLNYLSLNHRIATCRRLLRCLRCHGYRHLARDCKRPRSPANRASDMAVHDHFVHARLGPGSDGTSEGSKVSGPTPPNSPPQATARSPVLEERDPCRLAILMSSSGRAPASFSATRSSTTQKLACDLPSLQWPRTRPARYLPQTLLV